VSYHRPIDPPLALVSGASSLPDVVDETSGTSLSPLSRGLAAGGDTQRGLPRRLTLRGFAGPAQTVTIPRPVEIKVLSGGQWVVVGQLRLSDPPENPLKLTPNRGYLGRLNTSAEWTRIAIVAAGAIVGGVVTFHLLAELDVEVS